MNKETRTRIKNRGMLMLDGFLIGTALPFARIITHRTRDISPLLLGFATGVFVVLTIRIALEFFLMRRDIATFAYAMTVLFTVSFLLMGIGVGLLIMGRFVATPQPFINLIFGATFLIVGVGGGIAGLFAPTADI